MSRSAIVLAIVIAIASCGRLNFDETPDNRDAGSDAAQPSFLTENVTTFQGLGAITPNSITRTSDGGYAVAVRLTGDIEVDGASATVAGDSSTYLARLSADRTISEFAILAAVNETTGDGFCDMRDVLETVDGFLFAGGIVLGEGGNNGVCDGTTGPRQDPGLLSFDANFDSTLRLLDGNGGNAQVDELDLFSDGDLAVSGVYAADLTVFGTVLPTSANEAIYAARIDGTLSSWAVGFTTTPNTGRLLPGAIDVNDSDEMCLVARFDETAMFGGTQVSPVGDALAVVVVGLSANGDVRFATEIASAQADNAETILARPDGGCIVGGRVGGDARFGELGIKPVAGGSDAFIAQISSVGEFESANLYGSGGFEEISQLRFTDTGELIAAVHFTEQVAIAGETLTTAGNLDIAVFRVAGSQSVELLAQLGGPGDEEMKDLIVPSTDEMVALIRFDGETDIGGMVATSSDQDGLLAWLSR